MATAKTSWENSSLRSIHLYMYTYIAQHFILLRLNPFDLSVNREGSRFEHSVSWLRVLLSADCAKTFLGPDYLSEDVVL